MLRGLRRGLWGLFWRGRGCIDALIVHGRLERKKGCVWARYYCGLSEGVFRMGYCCFLVLVYVGMSCVERWWFIFFACISGTVAMKKKTAWFIAQ